MPGKDSSETKVESEVDNPVNSNPKLVSIQLSLHNPTLSRLGLRTELSKRQRTELSK